MTDDYLDDSCGIPGQPNTKEQEENAKEAVLQYQHVLINERWDRVKNGDTIELDRMLSIVSAAIRLNVPILPPLSDYIADAFLNIIGGQDANEALGYQFSPGGQERGLNRERKHLHGAMVEQVLVANPGMKVKEAREIIGNEVHLSEEAIKKHHLAYKKERTSK